MSHELETLESKRDQLGQQLKSIGDFRFGTISASYRKCGKKRCSCARQGHLGHGPQYLCTTKQGGKSIAQYLRLGPELDMVQKQIANGGRFYDWYREFVEINEKICRLRPVPQIEDAQELEALKKKLRKKFLKKPGKSSIS